MDDTSDVWRHHAHNLLRVERYIYFPSSRRQLNISRQSLFETNRCADVVRDAILLTHPSELFQRHPHS